LISEGASLESPDSRQLAENLEDPSPSIAGHMISHYLLTIIAPSGLRVLPMQIDEQSPNMWREAAAGGEISGTIANVFDGFDELLLSTADFSPLVSADGLPVESAEGLAEWLAEEAQAVFEITFAYLPHQSAHLWVLRSAVPQRFQAVNDRVSYDAQTHFAETDYFTLAADLGNPRVWQDMTFQGWPRRETGIAEGSFLDTLKIRLTGNTLSNTSAITITNRNFRARVLDVRDGLLRATVDVQANMVIAGVPIMYWVIEMQFYPKSIVMRLKSRTPSWVSLLLAETALSISFDGVMLKVARIHLPGAPVAVGMVDGKRSAVEALLANTVFESDEAWWMLRQPEHIQLFSRLRVLAPASIPISMIYEDDNQLKIAPERYLGQMPNIGFKLERFPLTVPLHLELWLRMDPPDLGYHSDTYLSHLASPPELAVTRRLVSDVIAHAMVAGHGGTVP
jgi:hypothetical protein